MTHHRCLTAEQAEAPTKPIRRMAKAPQPDPSAFLVEALRGAYLVAVSVRHYVVQKQGVIHPVLVRSVRDLDRSAAQLRAAVDAVVRSRPKTPKGCRR
jgi:hypothetical protein